MPAPAFIPVVASVLACLQGAGSVALEKLNAGHVRAHAREVPEAFRDVVTPEAYARSVAYTLAKGRMAMAGSLLEVAVLLAVVWSGVLPATLAWAGVDASASAWRSGAWLLGVTLLMSVPSLPLEWWAQFRLEARFGFNTTTPGTWVADRLKGVALSVALGWPLLAMILQWVHWAGSWWWAWAWVAVAAFQAVVLFLAPAVIMPWFNRFEPLPDGPLRDRLLALGRRTGFQAASIQVMDGSRRSRHANAFFTGFGSLRKIVLFDTLVAQLTPDEVEAVLAHEIGHHRCRHIPARLGVAMAMTLAGFAVMGGLATQSWFTGGFGFPPGSGVAPALLMFGLVSPSVLFWSTPLGNRWSRAHEFEADAYARRVLGTAAPLVSALRKLSEKNLSNLTPHPWYSAFHYSHPTLVEREAALLGGSGLDDASPSGRRGAA